MAQYIYHLIIILMICFLGNCEALSSNGECQLRDPCLTSSDCADGLFCARCTASGDAQLRCHRYTATNVTAIENGLPFNRYSWLTTHNSFAIRGEASLTTTNQEDNVTSQLQNGVRGFMLDMYDFLGDIWLCHSFGGVCYNFTAFDKAINTLREIEVFLAANTNEIITIFIEDYVRSPQGLTNLFTEAGLFKYWFPVSEMPKNGDNWPTITDMVEKNQRLIVFTSNRNKESSESIAYNWRYVNENQYGSIGMEVGKCTNRDESLALNATSRSLILMNFFPTTPIQIQACKYNSAPLEAMVPICYQAAGERWPNYVAVDFYKRSDGGGAFNVMDTINAGLICGCSNLDLCKVNARDNNNNIAQM